MFILLTSWLTGEMAKTPCEAFVTASWDSKPSAHTVLSYLEVGTLADAKTILDGQAVCNEGVTYEIQELLL